MNDWGSPVMGPPDTAAERPLIDARLGSDSGDTSVLLLTIGFAIAFLLFAVTLTGWILTTHGDGTRYLRQTLARVTEVDRLVLDGIGDIRRDAALSPEGVVHLPGYPIAVDLPSSFARDATPTELRSEVLRASAERVYDDGADAFLAEGGTAPDVRTFSATGVVRRSVTIVSSDNHARLTILLAVLALGGAALGAAVVLRTSDPASAIVALATAATIVATLLFAGSLAMRGILELVLDTEDDYVAVSLLTLGSDVALLALRTTLILASTGVAIVAAATIARRRHAPAT